jgi:hypothetical protein
MYSLYKIYESSSELIELSRDSKCPLRAAKYEYMPKWAKYCLTLYERAVKIELEYMLWVYRVGTWIELSCLGMESAGRLFEHDLRPSSMTILGNWKSLK